MQFINKDELIHYLVELQNVSDEDFINFVKEGFDDDVIREGVTLRAIDADVIAKTTAPFNIAEVHRNYKDSYDAEVLKELRAEIAVGVMAMFKSKHLTASSEQKVA